MNRLESWFCSSSFWRNMTRREVLPWLLEGAQLGEHVLEIGAGPGAATDELRNRAARVTSLEYSHHFAAGILRRDYQPMRAGFARRTNCLNRAVVQADASVLPFPEKTFDAAIAVLVVHHLKSRQAQDLAFAEIFRVLQPGGSFFALDVPDKWLHRIAHIRSTFVPLSAFDAPTRLASAGFASVDVAFRSGAFRLRAQRPS